MVILARYPAHTFIRYKDIQRKRTIHIATLSLDWLKRTEKV